MNTSTVLLFTFLLLTGCSASEPWVSKDLEDWHALEAPDEAERVYSLFLIGDTGDPSLDGSDPVFELLRSAMISETPQSAVVFLGDNIYDDGFVLDPPEEKERAKRITDAHISMFAGLEIPGFFVPGNHDWWSGLEGMQAQQDYIRNHSENKSTLHFTPEAGCPGPVTWNVHESILLVTLDSEWFLMDDAEDYSKTIDCTFQTRSQALEELRRINEQNQDKLIVLATHHPFLSRGEHGGKYTWKQHIFPLTELHGSLYIPLPVVGSLYPLIRNQGIGRQDFGSRFNKNYRADVLNQFSNHPLFVSAAGHDHNLQYIPAEGIHQIVSGSGSKKSYAIKGGDADFLLGDYGFAKLELYSNGQIWLEFWTTSVTQRENPVFRYPIDTLPENDL